MRVSVNWNGAPVGTCSDTSNRSSNCGSFAVDSAGTQRFFGTITATNIYGQIGTGIYDFTTPPQPPPPTVNVVLVVISWNFATVNVSVDWNGAPPGTCYDTGGRSNNCGSFTVASNGNQFFTGTITATNIYGQTGFGFYNFVTPPPPPPPPV